MAFFSGHRVVPMRSFCHVLIFSVCIFAVLNVNEASAAKKFRFGWSPGGEYVNSEAVAKNLVDYISRRMRVKIEAVKAGSEKELEKALKTGAVDFAFISNYGYPALASSTYIIATPEINDSSFMQLYVVVSKKSNIFSMRQLRGRKAAKAEGTSRLQCNFVASAIHGNPKRYFREIKRYKELKDVLYAVADGKADATCLNSDMFNLMVKYDPSLAKKLRIIKRSSVYPLHPLVASSGFLPEDREKLRKLCFYMNSDYAAQNIFMVMGIQGFARPVTDISAYPQTTVVAGGKLSERHETARSSHKQTKKEVVSPEKQVKAKARPPATATGKVPDSSAEGSHDTEKSGKAAREHVFTVSGAGTEPDLAGKKEKPADNTSQTGTKSMDVVASGNMTALAEKDNSRDTLQDRGSSKSADISAENQEKVSRSAFFNILTGPMHGRFQQRVIFGLVAIVVVCIMGFAILRFALRMRRRQKLTVVSLVRKNIISMQCVMDSEKDIAFRECDISPMPDDFGAWDFWEKQLDKIGHLAGMRLLGVIDSDRCRLHYYVLPSLPAHEIIPALEWKLKDDNIPYIQEEDFIQYSIIKKDRKKKKMVLLAEVFKREDIDWLYPEGKRIANGIVSVESCLLNCMGQVHDSSRQGRCALVYFFSRDEALMVFYNHISDVFSRRIFAVRSTDLHEMSEDYNWEAFSGDIAQTFRFYRDRYGVVDILYLAGKGVGDEPDPGGRFADLLDIEVKGLDVFAGVKDRTDLLNVCPQPEIMIGAARAWFSGMFRFSILS